MYSYGPPHMAKQKQDDQLELTYSSYVRTQDVTLKTCQRRWMIGRNGERGSGISVLAPRHDDDDDDTFTTESTWYAVKIPNHKQWSGIWCVYLSIFNPNQPIILPQLSFVNHHYHHVVPLARISLTLSRHFSLSVIASGRSSGLHPVSSHSCCMYVRAGHPAFARLYVGVHRSTSLMSSSLLLQQCPACLVRLTWIVFVMGGRWPYSWCFVGYCRQDLFNIVRYILV